VHDLLAFLAERMLEMNKQTQAEIKGFLGWLEGYLGAKAEDLTPQDQTAELLRARLRGADGGAQEERRSLSSNPLSESPEKTSKPSSRGRWANCP